MKYLNGHEEVERKVLKNASNSFWEKLPKKMDYFLENKIVQHIAQMSSKYDLYQEKNQLLSIAAQVNKLIEKKDNEIRRI